MEITPPTVHQMTPYSGPPPSPIDRKSGGVGSNIHPLYVNETIRFKHEIPVPRQNTTGFTEETPSMTSRTEQLAHDLLRHHFPFLRVVYNSPLTSPRYPAYKVGRATCTDPL